MSKNNKNKLFHKNLEFYRDYIIIFVFGLVPYLIYILCPINLEPIEDNIITIKLAVFSSLFMVASILYTFKFIYIDKMREMYKANRHKKVAQFRKKDSDSTVSYYGSLKNFYNMMMCTIIFALISAVLNLASIFINHKILTFFIIYSFGLTVTLFIACTRTITIETNRYFEALEKIERNSE
ncbi:MAG: hypothetical protein K0U45_07895 [Alphaproteobacteria bacterium]|nr:hypothetical protein [Alphaproteobacteria bacterium]